MRQARDLVLIDQPAQLIAEHVAASSAAQPLVRRAGSALIAAAEALTGGSGDEQAANERFLLDCLRLMVSTPALRARHLDSQYALQQGIVNALEADVTDPDASFRAQAATSACLVAMHTALTRWAENDGHPQPSRPDRPGARRVLRRGGRPSPPEGLRRPPARRGNCFHRPTAIR
ncbi:hypothetical protein [Streptomyces sp. NPDC001652]|uniref:hypothetical protein n=1 Tax=Streptomyces sp. NPDC001652 TaxID=3154393 RepID=UPI00332A05B9